MLEGGLRGRSGLWNRTCVPEDEDVRLRIRSGEYDGPTAGLPRWHVQTNLVILPGDYAFDFLKFCVRNPKPCPIVMSGRPPLMITHSPEHMFVTDRLDTEYAA